MTDERIHGRSGGNDPLEQPKTQPKGQKPTNEYSDDTTDDDLPFFRGSRARMTALLARGLQWAMFLIVAVSWLHADGASTAVQANTYALQALAAASVVVCIELLVTRPLRRRCR